MIDVHKQNEKGETALMIAAKSGGEHGLSMMRLLLDKGADVNKQENSGSTALMHAAMWGSEQVLSMMRLLLDKGAEVNKQDENGWTALMYASRDYGDRVRISVLHRSWTPDYGDETAAGMIQLLVNAGADINIKGKDNKTAYDIAVEEDNKIGIDILKQYQANWTFKWTTADKLQLKLWSEQNIKVATTILLCRKKSYLSKIPLDLLRAYILPMTIDRRDTLKEEEKMIRPSKRRKIG